MSSSSSSTPIRFFGTTCEFGAFSNMYPAKFTVNNVTFSTNEHFFQAKKFETTDPAYFNTVRTAATAKSAKSLGKSRKHPIRSDWNSARIEVMAEGLGAKFSQNEQLKKKLLQTGERELQESAPRDNFWGTGSKGKGQNMTGKLLMKVRGELMMMMKSCDEGQQKNVAVLPNKAVEEKSGQANKVKRAKKEENDDSKKIAGVAAVRAGKQKSD